MILKTSTEELLARSLEELLCEYAFEDISVKLLTSNCDTSRQTFYKHFSDKYALVCWIFSKQLLFAADTVAPERPWRETMAAMLRAVMENAPFYGKLLSVDAVAAELTGTARGFFSEYAAAQLAGEPMTMEMDFAIDFFSAALVYKMASWVKRGFKEPPETLAAYLEDCLPASLRPLFIERGRRLDYSAYEHGER